MKHYDIVTTYVCPTVSYYGIEVLGNKGVYTVEYKPINGSKQFITDWTCTCPATRYYPERGYCKHIKKVIDSGVRCGWNEIFEVVTYPEKGKCPKCQRPVNSIRIAV